MKEDDEVRIDKYLWAVRLFKTRTEAADACKKEKILISGNPVKPARSIGAGDEFMFKDNPIWRTFKVKQYLSKRVGAKLVGDYLEEITPEEELQKAEIIRNQPKIVRERGTGRPTKKDRRDLSGYFE
jgi:ribosome-associated heat shock protein Hsp15